jgi:ribose/xylose/arabinose/galactoside ABC-type transport system permease subunit
VLGYRPRKGADGTPPEATILPAGFLPDAKAPATPWALWRRRVASQVMLLLLAVIVAGLCIASPDFRSAGNLENLLDQDVTLAIVGSGMLCMMLTGGFDLSVGAAGAVAAVVAAEISIHHGILLGLVLGMVSGLGIGIMNGVCIALLDVNPFVTTLGSMTLWYGVLDVFTKGSPVSGTPGGWTNWGLTNWGPFAHPVYVAAVVLILVFVMLRFTVHGQHIYAVGSNMAAAGRAGLNVRMILCSVYAIGGLLAGVAGVITVSESGVGDPTTGSTWALTAIAAIVIGGTRLSGGVGGMKSVLVGTLLITVITNAFSIYNLSPFWVPVVTGIIIVVAVAATSQAGRVRGMLIKSHQI